MNTMPDAQEETTTNVEVSLTETQIKSLEDGIVTQLTALGTGVVPPAPAEPTAPPAPAPKPRKLSDIDRMSVELQGVRVENLALKEQMLLLEGNLLHAQDELRKANLSEIKRARGEAADEFKQTFAMIEGTYDFDPKKDHISISTGAIDPMTAEEIEAMNRQNGGNGRG